MDTERDGSAAALRKHRRQSAPVGAAIASLAFGVFAVSPASAASPLGPHVKAVAEQRGASSSTLVGDTASEPLIVGNNAAFGGGPIQTYDFGTGALVNSFVPDAANNGGNGRAVAVVGNNVFYSELSNGDGPSDAIHVAPFHSGAGGSDTSTLPNPAPSAGIQDLDYANGALYALTGYDTAGPVQAWKLDPGTGAVLSGPIVISTDPYADGFSVLPDGNFLINSGDASCSYAEYDSTTGAVTGSSFVVPGASSCTGVTTDGTSLYFETDFDSFTETDLAGNLIARTTVTSNLVEDISLVAGTAGCSSPPAAPTGVTNNFVYTRDNSGTGKVAVNWTAVPSACVASYNIVVIDFKGNPGQVVDTVPASITSDPIGGLNLCTFYRFGVQAVSTGGQLSTITFPPRPAYTAGYPNASPPVVTIILQGISSELSGGSWNPLRTDYCALTDEVGPFSELGEPLALGDLATEWQNLTDAGKPDYAGDGAGNNLIDSVELDRRPGAAVLL